MRTYVCLALLLALAAAAQAEYWPQGDARSGGMSAIALLYLDAWPSRYTDEDLLPYVAYLDKQQQGRPADWFYDAFLFLLGGCRTPAGRDANFMTGATTRADWEHYFTILFAPDRSLAALDKAVARAAVTLGPPPRKVPVILMIPYLSDKQQSFGVVDGTGQSLDLGKPDQAGRAVGWLVEETQRRFAAAQYSHLTLWGYYWMNEGIGKADEEKVKATARAVHQRGLGFTWIPYHGAPGRDKWRELGLDFAVQQPNYAFMDYNLPGPQDESRLSDTARECAALELGIEIETWDGALVNAEDRLSLTDYLNHGLPAYEGYMSALHADYVQDTVVRDLYRSELPANNRLYRDLYEFAKHTYRGHDYSVARGQECRVEVAGVPARLTRALTGEGPAPPADAALVPGSGGRLVVSFPDERRVSQVRMRVRPGRGASEEPFYATVSLWEEADQTERVVAQIALPAFAAGSVSPRWATGRWRAQAGRSLILDLQGPLETSVVVDQIRVLPPPGPDGNEPYTTDGTGGAGVVTDMQFAAGPHDTPALLQWPRGRASITFQPARDRNFSRLWLHAVRLPGGQWPARVEVKCGETSETTSVPELDAEWAAYLPVKLPVTRGRRVEVSLSGDRPDRALALDEVEFELADNLALDKPYTIEPAPAKPAWNYPDDGRKLTDGALAETFVDGKLAGWINSTPKVVIDLGQSVPVEKLRLHAWGGGAADTWFPPSVTIWTASDGQQWSLVPQKIRPPQEPPEAKTNAKAWLEGQVNAPAARYVRLDLTTHGFLLLDELEVISGGVNMARGKQYRVIAPPPPRPQGQYPDDGRKLTDGRYCAPYLIPEKVVGYPGMDPTVTVDLQEPRKVTLASVHACGGGLFGVFYPAETTVQTSLDGTAWSPAIRAQNTKADAGGPSVGLIETALDATARYVRWHFTRHGMCLIDEVEVYGG